MTPERLRCRYIALVLLSMLAGQAWAQLHNFDHYGLGDGLPQSQVLAIYQDADGYLWLGTYGGLSRYNGREFKNFTSEHGLSANVVQAIVSDRHGRLWVGTGSGACYLQEQTQRFVCPEHPLLTDTYVYALYAEADRIWIGTSENLLEYHLDSGEVIDAGARSGLGRQSVRAITRNSDGQLVVGTLAGLAREDEQGRLQVQAIPGQQHTAVRSLFADQGKLWVGSASGPWIDRQGVLERPPGIPPEFGEADITAIGADKSGAIWMASERGALHWQATGSEWLTSYNGLPGNNLHSVLVDAEGMAWMGHDAGVSKRIPSPFSGYNEHTGLHNNFVRTIAKDHRHYLWLGTRQGVQVIPYRDGQWDFGTSTIMTSKHGLPDSRVFSLAFPGDGTALIGTAGGLAIWREDSRQLTTFGTADGLPDNRVLAVFHDRQGHSWLGTAGGLAFYREGRIEPAPTELQEIAYPIRFQQDLSGRIWIATVEQGAWVVDDDGSPRRLDASSGVTNETIWDMAPDESGGMWLGSNGDGLFHVDADGSVRRYRTDDGLPNDFIWQVLRDRQGRIWAYTNRGLVRYSEGQFRHFGLHDGLLDLEGTATGALECHTGNIWFGTGAGLMRYQADREFLNQRPPPINIESVLLEGQPLVPGSVIQHQAGSLDFHYAGLSFQAESQLRYRYRVVGISDRWSDPMPYRPITLAGLGGGEYVFEVSARNPHGVWSTEPARFAFSVRPPLWARPWFWMLIFPMLVLALWLLMRHRLRLAEQREQQLEMLVRDRTSELEEANRRLEAATITDPLTGLKNRRYLVSQVRADVAQTLRAYRNVSDDNRDIVFMMIDLDHFKEINDSYGHHAGDAVLRGFAQLISSELRESDYVVRWGGEEFLVVARQADAGRCGVLVQRLIEQARQARFTVEHANEPLRCTCSIGVSHLPFRSSHPAELDWEQVVDLADSAVYMAKRAGRNGWVAIHGVGKQPLGDVTEFLRRVQRDPASLVEQGLIEIESSFADPLVDRRGAPNSIDDRGESTE